ncbi:MAG TPA: hypothetical protein VJT49_00405 [Amycolatopsis sp.]|nr:hypothetical protein [Amycolatopsis sp.]HKS43576.1 hypothetical protein [Amycolatopsis sp.]
MAAWRPAGPEAEYTLVAHTDGATHVTLIADRRAEAVREPRERH